MDNTFSTAVFKVKCGNILRRFSVEVNDGELDLTLDELKRKIISFYSLSPVDKLILTYVDEDGDVVDLVDADDMHDMMKQDLNPVRITVQVSSEQVMTSTSLRSHQGEQKLQNLHAGVTTILRNVQCLHAKLFQSSIKSACDLAAMGFGSSQHVAELVDDFSKVGLFYLDQNSATLTRDQPSKNNEPGSSLSKKDNSQESDISKVNADKLKVSSNGIQEQALENSESVKKVQSKGGKEDELELRNASGNSPVPIVYSSPNTCLGSSEVPLNLSTSCSTLHGVSSFEQNTGQSNGACATFFHFGVCCNGCGMHPITSPRFKSIVKLDYDLCYRCFLKMGNHTDYIRMDHPAVYRNHVSANGICNYALTQSQVYCKKSKSKPHPSKLNCNFIQDVNVLDGTVMAPLTPFTKVWRMRNSGMVEWPQKTGLVFIGGNLLRKESFVKLKIPPAGIPVGQEMDVSVDFIAPARTGMYASYWAMVSPHGKQFGQRIWVIIEVRSSGQYTPSVSVTSGLNLNLLPENGNLGRNPEPVPNVEDSQSPENNERRVDELAEPTVEVQPDFSQEMNFPINDSLLFGNGTTISDDIASAYARLPLPESKIELQEKMEVEEKLGKELEQMGFKEIDSNKEVPSNYSDSLIDRLNFDSDWDPIIDELREMGFGDVETNKKLLEKNKGSITRVVMQLIAEEDDLINAT